MSHDVSIDGVCPLVLEPILLEKVWGGRSLERLGKRLPRGDAKYGESWELADMGSTSASGAGGGAVRSVVKGGPYAGRLLGEMLGAWGERMLAPVPAAATSTGIGEFPLLVKFLDAKENLSVQVHPSPSFASRHAGANLKTECWYILDAQPGAVIYKGIKAGVSRAEFERLVRANDPGIVDALVAVPAVVGECHNLPSGTVHALGAGVVVAEVQTPSDTTYRCYDWGRVGRALHVEETLACASFAGEQGHDQLLAGLTVGALRPGELCARLVSTAYFSVDEVRLGAGDELTVARSCQGCGGCFVLVMLAGACELRAGDGSFETVKLSAGDTAVVPRDVSGKTWMQAGVDVRVLRVAVGEGKG